MQTPEIDKWNRKYREGDVLIGKDPSAFLVEWIDFIERETGGQRALDIACGQGRNSLFLARRGFEVLGVDGSEVAVEKARDIATSAGLQIEYRNLDVREELPDDDFDLVIMFNFLVKSLIPSIFDLVAPAGFLMIQTALQSWDESGTPRHNPEFALEPGELERLVAPLGGEVICLAEDAENWRSQVLVRKPLPAA